MSGKDLIASMEELEKLLYDNQEQMGNILLDYFAAKRNSEDINMAYEFLSKSLELLSKEKQKMEKRFADNSKKSKNS